MRRLQRPAVYLLLILWVSSNAGLICDVWFLHYGVLIELIHAFVVSWHISWGLAGLWLHVRFWQLTEAVGCGILVLCHMTSHL